MEEIARFDPRVDDWLFSVSWQFLQFNTKVASLMPDPAVWAGTTGSVPLQGQTTAPVPLAATPAQTPRPTRAPVPAAVRPAAPAPAGDEDVMEDLQALYAIRDAAISQGRGGAKPGPAGQNDFESTRPGSDDAGPSGPVPPPKRW